MRTRVWLALLLALELGFAQNPELAREQAALSERTSLLAHELERAIDELAARGSPHLPTLEAARGELQRWRLVESCRALEHAFATGDDMQAAASAELVMSGLSGIVATLGPTGDPLVPESLLDELDELGGEAERLVVDDTEPPRIRVAFPAKSSLCTLAGEEWIGIEAEDDTALKLVVVHLALRRGGTPVAQDSLVYRVSMLKDGEAGVELGPEGRSLFATVCLRSSLLEGHEPAVGDQLEYWAVARDHVLAARHVVSTPRYVIRLVSDTDMLRWSVTRAKMCGEALALALRRVEEIDALLAAALEAHHLDAESLRAGKSGLRLLGNALAQTADEVWELSSSVEDNLAGREEDLALLAEQGEACTALTERTLAAIDIWSRLETGWNDDTAATVRASLGSIGDDLTAQAQQLDDWGLVRELEAGFQDLLDDQRRWIELQRWFTPSPLFPD